MATKTKKKKRKPSGAAKTKMNSARIKQKKVLALMDKGMSRRKAMREAGYSKSYSDSSNVADSRTWKEIVEEEFPDAEVVKVHKERLYSKEIRQMPFFHKLSDAAIKEIIEAQGFKFFSTKRFMHQAYVYFTVPDSMSILKALDFIYKIKNRYGDTTVIHKFSELSDEDLERETAEILAEAQAIADGEEEES